MLLKELLVLTHAKQSRSPVPKLDSRLDNGDDDDHDDPHCDEMMMIISTMIISLASLPRVSAEQ